MHFQGDFEAGASQTKVFAVLTDPRQIAGCMPGLQKIDMKSADEFDAVIKVGAGFVRGDFAMHFRIAEKDPTSRAKMLAHGSGLGSAVDLQILVRLGPGKEGRTAMSWTADATVSGKLASVGQRLIESTAQKIIDQFFDCLRGKLEAT